jgi:hypothetical protein
MSIRGKVADILAMAFVFETRAKTFLKLAGMHHSFVWALNDMLQGDSVTVDEAQKWFELNQSQLGNTLDKRWDLGSSNGNYHLYSWLETNSKGQDIYGFITSTTTPPDDIDVKKSSILQPLGKIPRFWLWLGVYTYNQQTSKLSLDLSHNEFIVDAITGLYSVSQSPQTLDKITKCVEENKTKINRIRSMFTTQPKYLGGGADGRAYAISPTAVLKLFRDTYSYNEAVKAVERLHKNPELAKTEAMIYDVGVLGTFDNEPLYYYIIEQMKTVRSLSPTIQNALEKIVGKFVYYITDARPSKWRAIKKKINDPKEHAAIKAEVTNGAKEMVAMAMNDLPERYFREVENGVEVRETWLQSLAEELLMKYLTGRTDLHMGNIGLTGYGEFRYFDPAYGGHDSDINAPMG